MSVKHPYYMFCINAEDQISHPYKTVGKICIFVRFNLYDPNSGQEVQSDVMLKKMGLEVERES
jgi:hypothetical protein